jgi:hypothetical protein
MVNAASKSADLIAQHCVGVDFDLLDKRTSIDVSVNVVLPLASTTGRYFPPKYLITATEYCYFYVTVCG